MIEPLTSPDPKTTDVGYPFGGDWRIQAAELEFGLTLDEIAGRLRGARQLAFLDSTRRDVDTGRYSYLTADPFQVLRSWGWRVELAGQHDHCLLYGDAWTFLGDLLRRVRIETVPGLPPFQTGVVGYFGYDLGRLLERLPASANDDLGLPDMQLGFYDWTLAADHETGRSWLIVAGAGCRPRPAIQISTRMAVTGDQPFKSPGCCPQFLLSCVQIKLWSQRVHLCRPACQGVHTCGRHLPSVPVPAAHGQL